MTRRAVAALAVLVALAACSSAGDTADDPARSPSMSVSVTTTTVTVTTTPSTPPTTSSPPTSPIPSSTPKPPAGPLACTTAQLDVTVAEGGAVQGQQFAGLEFANVSARPCRLSGFPRAQLVRRGQLIARPAGHVGPAGPGVVLAARATAEALLSARTGCNAPLSDHVRVTAPGTTKAVDLVVELRACTLGVEAVKAA